MGDRQHGTHPGPFQFKIGLCALALVACGRIGIENLTDPRDTSIPVPIATDNNSESCGGDDIPCPTCEDGMQNGNELRTDCGGPDCAPCPPCETDFGPPEPITGLDLSGDLSGPTLCADGLTLFIAAGQGDDTDIYTADRDSRDAVFTSAAPVPELNSPDSDGGPYLTLNGLTVYFHSTRGGEGTRNLWEAGRTHEAAPFQEPAMLFWIRSESNDELATLTHDEAIFIFASDRPEGEGGYDLWSSRLSSRGDYYEIPENIDELNTGHNETAPSLTGDGLTLYFVSDRPGGRGDTDIWMTTRPSLEDAFIEPIPVEGINTEFAEEDVTLTADEREIFFISDRGEGAELWRAQRECPR